MTTPVPNKLGKYDVVGVIGRGGMGVVYKGRDPQLDRLVAIKMITTVFAENPDMLKRFFREAQSLGSLQHPNIVTVFDLGDFCGNPYLVMEFLEGEGLDSVLSKQRQLTLLDKISIIIQVCRGLAYAHRRGVVHRDIKPANIMLHDDGNVKIFDFGIAHAGNQSVTRTGQVIGTLTYMAPEQFKSRSIDPRTDIFSTGVVLYQLLTNHLPFEGENTAITMMKIVNEPPPPISSFLSSYPAEIEEILLRALAKNPGDRYASADELGLDLEQLQGRLKEELIGRELKEVALLLDRGEIYKAQGSLVRVLKVDQQHTTANRLLREVQQRIQREEIGKQVRELRQRAEDAMAEEQFQQALEHIDRALGLDRHNTDLQQLRETICMSAVRSEKLHNALRLAEAAQAEGNLDEAKLATEAALALSPEDTQARTLHRLILREIEARVRHQQVEGYLSEARQEISSRRFTAALEILKRAEELDPAAPQVHSLIGSASAGQEQERRRRELEAWTHEVEHALNSDDYCGAFQKAEEGLARFPEDRNLLKLKTLADRQRQIEERKLFVEKQLASARVLLQAGLNEDLRLQLEDAISHVGPEPRLQSLLEIVRENLERERRERSRVHGLRRAAHSLDNLAFDEAIQNLEELVKEVGDDPEIQELLVRARREQKESVHEALRRADHESDLNVRAQILQDELRRSPRNEELKQQFHTVRNLVEVISKIATEAQRMEEAHRYDQALAKWEAVRTIYPQYPDLEATITRIRDLCDRAHTDALQDWIEKIEHALRICDYSRALAHVETANQEFPVDSDLMELQQKAETGLRLRSKAQKILAEGQNWFASQQWESGVQCMMRAFQLANQDSLMREQVVSQLTQAARATMQSNWHVSEIILQKLAEIQPGAASLEDLRIKMETRRKEEAISAAVDLARKRQAVGDLPGAVREVMQTLACYPGDPRLTELVAHLETRIVQAEKSAQLEEARREREATVLDAIERGQKEAALDVRIHILEEALQKVPNENRLIQRLDAARALLKRVESLASEARALEELHQHAQAVAKWEALAAVYRDYPGLEQSLQRARQLDHQARLESKANYIALLQQALSSADYSAAEDLLSKSKREFPADQQLTDIGIKVREGLARRAQAEKSLEAAAKAVDRQKWKKALELYQEAHAAAKSDPVTCTRVVSGMLSAADAVEPSDTEMADIFISTAARLVPDSPLLLAAQSRMEERKREKRTKDFLSAAQRCISAEDWQGAIRSLDRGLAVAPQDPRLIKTKERIEAEIRKRQEAADGLKAAQQREKEVQQTHQGPMSPTVFDAANVSATRIFGKGATEAAPEAATVRVPDVSTQSTTPAFQHTQSLASPQVPQASGSTQNQSALPHHSGDRSKQSPAGTVSRHADGNAASFDVEQIQSHPGSGSDQLLEALLPTIERQFAAFIGPLAHLLVKRAAAKTNSILELYSILAANLEREEDRIAFLARRSDLSFGHGTPSGLKPAPTESRPGVTTSGVESPGEITPAAIEVAARKLAAHLGPIAQILARKDARRATSLLNFYELLAEHVADPIERKRFLLESELR